MRRIILSHRDEFTLPNKADYLRGAAVKMFASLIQKTTENNASDKDVVVSLTNTQPRELPKSK